MHPRRNRLFWRMVLAVSLSPFVCEAVDLPHYDLDSLTYMSSDIVIATMSVDSHQRIGATVNEVLYGSLHPGDKLDKLNTPATYLSAYLPMKDGQRVILFVDRRPNRWYDRSPEASEFPMAVPPSGVYLIDADDHVHEYYQEINPGPYVAKGYQLRFKKRPPAKQQHLGLPSLPEVRARIAASLKWVQPIRPLLDKVATRDDVPALMGLLDNRAKAHPVCRFSLEYDAILERAGFLLRSLNDPDISLRSYSLASEHRAPAHFVESPGRRPDPEFTASRVKYLLRTLADHEKELPLRVAALEILLGLNNYFTLDLGTPPTGRQTDPIKPRLFDSGWLSPSVAEIQATARKVFDDDSQDLRLRCQCARFLPLDQPDVVANVKRIYTTTRSEELRFAIEEAFLTFSDVLYASLNPPGGPIASLVTLPTERGCFVASPDNIAFLLKYWPHDPAAQSTVGPLPRMVLTKAGTGERFAPKTHPLFGGGGGGRFEIALGFELSLPPELPVGDYFMAPEWSRNGKVISTGHGLVVTVAEGPRGKMLTVKPAK